MPATQPLAVTPPIDPDESDAAFIQSILPPHSESDLEHWIATEGVRIYDEMRADPSRGMTSEEVFASLGIAEEDEDDFLGAH
jgi:hypothetical protein